MVRKLSYHDLSDINRLGISQFSKRDGVKVDTTRRNIRYMEWQDKVKGYYKRERKGLEYTTYYEYGTGAQHISIEIRTLTTEELSEDELDRKVQEALERYNIDHIPLREIRQRGMSETTFKGPNRTRVWDKDFERFW